MKTLSQSGFHRIPKNPKQRPFQEGGSKVTGTKLDAFNEKAERTLHPTKGWRSLNLKSARASALVQNIKSGGSADLGFMRRFLNGEA